MPAAARMLTTHPSIQMQMVAADWADVPRAVREWKAVIGLVDQVALDNPADFAVEPMHTQRGLFVVRPGHPLRGRLSGPHPPDRPLLWGAGGTGPRSVSDAPMTTLPAPAVAVGLSVRCPTVASCPNMSEMGSRRSENPSVHFLTHPFLPVSGKPNGQRDSLRWACPIRTSRSLALKRQVTVSTQPTGRQHGAVRRCQGQEGDHGRPTAIALCALPI